MGVEVVRKPVEGGVGLVGLLLNGRKLFLVGVLGLPPLRLGRWSGGCLMGLGVGVGVVVVVGKS